MPSGDFIDTAGFVLAGGASSRMGTNKALLVLDGCTLLEIAISALRQAAGRVTIIGPTATYSGFGCPVIPDLRPDNGPLAGIETALTATQSTWNLIVACDMPALLPATIRQILDAALAAPDAAVVMPESAAGRLEPLCAAWHVRALPFIQHALDRGSRKVTGAVPKELVRTIHLNDAGAFQNVNTPEQWQSAIEMKNQPEIASGSPQAQD